MFYFKHTDKYGFVYPLISRIPLLLSVLVLISGVGCASGDKPEQVGQKGDSVGQPSQVAAPIIPPWKDPKYADFQSAQYENVIVNYPPGHVHEAQMPQAAKDYKSGITKISTTLGLPVPTDTIRIYYFTGPGQGVSMTGHGFPFGDSLAVYYWPNYSRGVSLMQRLFYSYFGGWSVQPIMHHGLIGLFDFAGENHHVTTLEYLRGSLFIPLPQLAVDTLFNSDAERYQTAEAASLVAFILATKGIAPIEALYHSTAPFDQAVPQAMGISLDSLQKEWIAFIEANVGPIDTVLNGTEN